MELIDVRKVIEKKSPRLASRIPRFVTNWLSRLIHQEELNELLIYGDGLSNVEFITAVLDKLEIGREIVGLENLAEELKDSSVVVASYDAGDNMLCSESPAGRH